MGAGASALPSRLNEAYCKSIMKELYSSSAFVELVDSEMDSPNDGCISSQTFAEYISTAHDVFLSHNWGKDKSNHSKVVQIATMLRQEGFKVWLDEDHMQSNIIDAMNQGIDRSRLVIVCVTAEYQKKVSGHGSKGDKDNCMLEYYRALSDKGTKGMIPVVMDPAMLDTAKWYGPLKSLNQELYQNCSGGDSDEKELYSRQLQELSKYLQQRLGAPLKSIIQTFTNSSDSDSAKPGKDTPSTPQLNSAGRPIRGTITTPSLTLTLPCPEGVFDERIDVDGNTHLIRACRSGSHKEVGILIGDGADVNKPGQHDNTGLHWAAKSGHFACVALLLEHKADVHHKDHTGTTIIDSSLVWSLS